MLIINSIISLVLCFINGLLLLGLKKFFKLVANNNKNSNVKGVKK